MILTGHWSVTEPVRLRDYHIEFGAQKIPDDLRAICKKAFHSTDIPWDRMKELFTIYKNFDFDTVTSYGTYHLNSDPRDHSANIEVAALCMGGSDVSTTGSWGSYPFTYVHLWMMAAIMARISFLKRIDTLAAFSTDVEPTVLQNGPIYVISTHGERALQTNDDGEDTIPQDGYFIFSGDGNCRWDIACKDQEENHLLSTPSSAIASCKDTAKFLREKAHQIKASLTVNSDFFGLDKPHD